MRMCADGWKVRLPQQFLPGPNECSIVELVFASIKLGHLLLCSCHSFHVLLRGDVYPFGPLVV